MKNEYFDEKQHRRNKGIFYATVSIVTLVIAIIGASFSYFIASASSGEGTVTTGSTSYSLEFKTEDETLLNKDLIPADNNVAYYGAVVQDYYNGDPKDEIYTSLEQNSLTFDKTLLANTKCRDDHGNAVCSVYIFTITNPTTSGTDQVLLFKLLPDMNNFKNLYMMAREYDSEEVIDPDSTEKTNMLLSDYHLVELGEENLNSQNPFFSYNVETSTYVYDLKEDEDHSMMVTVPAGESKTIEFIIYIKNLDEDQTVDDANKNFSATVVASPLGSESKIYGRIAAASGKFGD